MSERLTKDEVLTLWQALDVWVLEPRRESVRRHETSDEQARAEEKSDARRDESWRLKVKLATLIGQGGA